MKSLIAVLLFALTVNTAAGPGSLDHKETACIAEAIYKESRGEPYRGQLAVGQVVMNRIRHKDYPSSACEVVFQKHQFSWTKQFKGFSAPTEFIHMARKIRTGKHEMAHFKATHFHATYVSPNWRKLKRITTIGNHIFYI